MFRNKNNIFYKNNFIKFYKMAEILIVTLKIQVSLFLVENRVQ